MRHISTIINLQHTNLCKADATELNSRQVVSTCAAQKRHLSCRYWTSNFYRKSARRAIAAAKNKIQSNLSRSTDYFKLYATVLL